MKLNLWKGVEGILLLREPGAIQIGYSCRDATRLKLPALGLGLKKAPHLNATIPLLECGNMLDVNQWDALGFRPSQSLLLG